MNNTTVFYNYNQFLSVVPLKNSEGINTYPEKFCKDIVYSLLAIYIMYSSSFNVDNS